MEHLKTYESFFDIFKSSKTKLQDKIIDEIIKKLDESASEATPEDNSMTERIGVLTERHMGNFLITVKEDRFVIKFIDSHGQRPFMDDVSFKDLYNDTKSRYIANSISYDSVKLKLNGKNSERLTKAVKDYVRTLYTISPRETFIKIMNSKESNEVGAWFSGYLIPNLAANKSWSDKLYAIIEDKYNEDIQSFKVSDNEISISFRPPIRAHGDTITEITFNKKGYIEYTKIGRFREDQLKFYSKELVNKIFKDWHDKISKKLDKFYDDIKRQEAEKEEEKEKRNLRKLKNKYLK